MINIIMNQYDILLEQLNTKIDEGRLARVLSAAAAAGAMTMGGVALKQNFNKPEQTIVQQEDANNISESGKQFIRQYEQLRTKPYDDQTGKTITTWNRHATIGWGHLIPQTEWDTYKNGISKQEADELFKSDLEKFIPIVRETIKVKLNQNQFDALTSLAFNIGSTNFKNSSIVKLINGEEGSEYADKKTAWLAWNKSNKKYSRGLQKRREAEWKTFDSPEK